MSDIDEAEIRGQLTEAFESADYPVANQMDLIPALPNGPATKIESGEFSMTIMELGQAIDNGTQEFPYDSVEQLVDDTLDALREEGIV